MFTDARGGRAEWGYTEPRRRGGEGGGWKGETGGMRRSRSIPDFSQASLDDDDGLPPRLVTPGEYGARGGGGGSKRTPSQRVRLTGREQTHKGERVSVKVPVYDTISTDNLYDSSN